MQANEPKATKDLSLLLLLRRDESGKLRVIKAIEQPQTALEIDLDGPRPDYRPTILKPARPG